MTVVGRRSKIRREEGSSVLRGEQFLYLKHQANGGKARLDDSFDGEVA